MPQHPDRTAHFATPPLLKWLSIDPDTRPSVYEQVFASSDFRRVGYWLEIFLSAGIATFGLVQNSPAVIIGAMLISPLMGPIMSTGMALAIGDLYLGIRAILTLIASLAVSVGFSAGLVWILPFHSVTSEILARTKPNLLDLGVALFSGLAGSVSVSKSGNIASSASTSLPGVAIAVALMPPLCTIGFGLGSGPNVEIVAGAGLLFLTNLVAIVASAFAIFLFIGMGNSQVNATAAALRQDDPLFPIILRGSMAPVLTQAGHLRWRVLMIVVVLASIAVPLQRAFRQVASETVARGAVQAELKHLVSPDLLVSQQVQIDPDRIAIRVISTQPIPSSKVAEFRELLESRTKRKVDVSVDAVASKSELTELLERMKSPVVLKAEPAPVAVDGMQQQLTARVMPALLAVWPVEAAPIQGTSIGLGDGDTVLHVTYQAASDLGEIPIGIILKNLRTSLADPGLTLTLERTPPPRPPPSKRRRR